MYDLCVHADTTVVVYKLQLTYKLYAICLHIPPNTASKFPPLCKVETFNKMNTLIPVNKTQISLR
jgi:hypothetical protein